MGISIGVDDIEVVFNAVGAICAASVTPLFPCLYYVSLIIQKKQPRTSKFYLAIVVFSIMVPYCIFSIVSLYIDMD